ncbi:hypothetical protein CQW23_18181 [Capsicum baccatum]|uniref:F-box/LRR-repeat protein 15-like leucin rich repeat domain-containing protein n=1 Tax=Capsicum baccatum TaxID=33114 RepID=A0A2G2WFX8_CAPBA|nr:hypothetical protein CQW23_18181 [Capsicum baccatum]
MHLHPLVSSTSNLLNEAKFSKVSLVRRLYEDNLNSITDLALLGAGDLPIVQLWIRSCERVIEKGIKSLSHADRKICKTLSVLDVGYIAKITNAAIYTITSSAKALTDLSIGFCNEVTDAAVQMLMERLNHISSQLIVSKRENLHAICKVQPRLVCAVLDANLGAVMARNGTKSDD